MNTETDSESRLDAGEVVETGAALASAIDPDFSAEVVEDLYRHRPSHMGWVLPLAVFLGPFGGHRFYLGYFWSGIGMLLTFGGGMVWCVYDLLTLRRLIDQSNAIEAEREAAGLPPRALSFLPPKKELDLVGLPDWAPLRAGRRRIIASGFLLALIGFLLGTTSSAMAFYEPVVVLCIFVVVSGLAARLPGLRHIPVINALVRWVHRLRLFYYNVDPGSVWAVIARPTIGILAAPWQAKIRAEIRLHLQMGGLVVVLFSLFDVVEMINTGSIFSGLLLLAGQFLQTILCTYLFVAPAAALLTTQHLLEARDSTIWILSAVTLVTMAQGFS